jgi:hypothetical protein
LVASFKDLTSKMVMGVLLFTFKNHKTHVQGGRTAEDVSNLLIRY